MLWNIILYILHLAQIVKHCLHSVLRFPLSHLHNTTPVDSTELPITNINPTSLYSSIANEAELARIGEQHPLHPEIRRWRTTIDFQKNTPAEALYDITLSPQVTLTGPLLKQGIIIQQKGERFYLREELGRRPEHREQISMVAVDLRTHHTFLIHLPFFLVDLSNIVEQVPQVNQDNVDSIV